MPKRKTRRVKSRPTLTWRRLFIYFIPVVIGVLIINQASGGAVLGLSDSNLFNLGKKEASLSAKTKPKPTCNRVTVFSASTICDSTKERENNTFKSYTYTCEDGVTGSVEQTKTEGRCFQISKAYELARKACQKKCIPTKTPKPTRAEPTKSGSNL